MSRNWFLGLAPHTPMEFSQARTEAMYAAEDEADRRARFEEAPESEEAMRTVTKYQANDGSEWDTVEQCEDHERLLERIEAINAILSDHPVDGNDDVGVQHDPMKVALFVTQLKELAAEECPQYAKEIILATSGNSIGGRILNDGNSPAWRLWYRWMCIDRNGREFGQPYYALQSNKG